MTSQKQKNLNFSAILKISTEFDIGNLIKDLHRYYSTITHEFHDD